MPALADWAITQAVPLPLSDDPEPDSRGMQIISVYTAHYMPRACHVRH